MACKMQSFGMNCMACLIALLAASATAIAADTCDLEQYDTSSLNKQDYWFFNVSSSSQCASKSDSCQVYFTFCKPLPPGVCRENTQSGVCQTSTANYSYSLGQPNRNLTASTDGFFAIYMDGSKNISGCDSTVVTNVTLVCNNSASWDFSNPDITRHVKTYSVDGCKISIEIWYSGACVKEHPVIAGCNSLGRYYNKSALMSDEPWIAKVDNKYCTEGPSSLFSNGALSVGGAADTCVLFFSFCSSLPSGYCYDSIFCYQEPIDTLPPVSFGKYNRDFKVEENADYTGFTISAYDGTQTPECPGGLMSTLVFTCSNSSEWTSVDISMFTHPQPRDKADPCNFEVRFNYSGACADNPPQPGKKGGNNKGSAIVGWILIGIFFGVLVLYLCVGVVVQLARRKKGVELIPNYKQWKMFFILVLEGCQFTLDIVTCFRCKKPLGSSKYSYDSL